MSFVIRWLVTPGALALAVRVVPGLSLEGSGWSGLVLMALVLGLVNAFVRPVIKLLTLPLTILTLGLFILVINAAMLWLAAWISGQLLPTSRFVIDGVLPALVGAIFVSIVSTFLSSVLIDER